VSNHDDSDETEGRRLYRAQADALAKAQVAMGKRRVRLAEDKETPSNDLGRLVPKHGSGP
jgi:hypothetical protein